MNGGSPVTYDLIGLFVPLSGFVFSFILVCATLYCEQRREKNGGHNER
jgi:hypothetical protein